MSKTLKNLDAVVLAARADAKTAPLSVVVTAAESALTVAERVGAVINPEGADGLYPPASDEIVARLAAIFADGKPPRVVGQNPDSVENLTKRYNALVPLALSLAIRAKVHTSLFGTVAGGKDVLSKLEAAIAEKQVEKSA